MVLLGFVIKYVLKDHFKKLVSGEGVKCKSCLWAMWHYEGMTPHICKVGALDTWKVHEKSLPCAKQTNSSWFWMLDQLLARKWKILEF